jgi:hypothetical protein
VSKPKRPEFLAGESQMGGLPAQGTKLRQISTKIPPDRLDLAARRQGLVVGQTCLEISPTGAETLWSLEGFPE